MRGSVCSLFILIAWSEFINYICFCFSFLFLINYAPSNIGFGIYQIRTYESTHMFVYIHLDMSLYSTSKNFLCQHVHVGLYLSPMSVCSFIAYWKKPVLKAYNSNRFEIGNIGKRIHHIGYVRIKYSIYSAYGDWTTFKALFQTAT